LFATTTDTSTAAAPVDAAEGYVSFRPGWPDAGHPGWGNEHAELGLSLAEMIRQDKIHAISCTGANLEEDLYNLVAHDSYVRVPNYGDLPQKTNRHCWSAISTASPIPASPKKRRSAGFETTAILAEWQAADQAWRALFPA
jgi:deoxyhypusine synthase